MCRAIRSASFKTCLVRDEYCSRFLRRFGLLVTKLCVALSFMGRRCGRASGTGVCGLWGGRKTGRCHHGRFLGTKPDKHATVLAGVDLQILFLLFYFALYQMRKSSAASLHNNKKSFSKIQLICSIFVVLSKMPS